MEFLSSSYSIVNNAQCSPESSHYDKSSELKNFTADLLLIQNKLEDFEKTTSSDT